VKPSDQGKGILLRIFSIADRPVQAVLRLPEQITAVYETNLKEERIRQLEPNSGSLTITMEPSQIETYEFE
jgi:alpha-mannosidase